MAKKNQLGICRLCQQEKKLCSSHIIPEFMYKNIYDTDHTFQTLKVENKTIPENPKKRRRGITEMLFCEECEELFSKYESYASEFLYNRNQKNVAQITHKAGQRNVEMRRFRNVDYKKFKIFLMSILYRLSIADNANFPFPNFSDTIREQLRIAIFQENPLKYDDFGCIIQEIMIEDLPMNYNRGIITHQDNTNVYIDVFMFSFTLDSDNIIRRKEHFLKTDGTMNITKISFCDMKEFWYYYTNFKIDDLDYCVQFKL